MRTPDFETVYRDLRTPVLKLCLHLTGNRALAEDAAQETFLAVHQGLAAFRGEAQVSTWVYRIAVRASLRARARGNVAEAPALEHATAHPSVELEAREDVRRLLAALQRLSVEHRTTLSLFALEGLSHAQVAAVLGIPEGTVWSRLHLARKRLAADMDAQTTAGRPGAVARASPPST